MLTGRVFNVQRFSVHDGPGIRTTVFLKGCPLACAWCHNPEGMSLAPEIVRNESRCIACGACHAACAFGNDPSRCVRCGACAEACPTGARQLAGRDVDVDDLLGELLRDRPFFDESGGGVTLSGGEPLLQAAFAAALLAALRGQGVHAALDTSGFAPRDALLTVAPLADLVLYDVKLVDDARHRAATGVPSEPILDNLRALAAIHPAIWLRVPVIPGINDDDANLAAIARLAAELPGIARVHLLPYHRAGVAKFARLAKDCTAGDIAPPGTERMDDVSRVFAAAGLDVRIGG